ncbi:hypothetical protein D3C73_1255480 [compost metagenome]
MVAFAAWSDIHQRHIHCRMRLRYRLTTGFTQQHWPASDRQLRAGCLEVVQAAHAPWHDQRMIRRAPEQHTTFGFATADRSQKILLGVQALLDGEGQGLIGH